MADRSDYPQFVAACWTRLLRTAYLLVQDWPAAEDLTQAALVKAWLAWPRRGRRPRGIRPEDHRDHARVVVAATQAAP